MKFITATLFFMASAVVTHPSLSLAAPAVLESNCKRDLVPRLIELNAAQKALFLESKDYLGTLTEYSTSDHMLSLISPFYSNLRTGIVAASDIMFIRTILLTVPTGKKYIGAVERRLEDVCSEFYVTQNDAMKNLLICEETPFIARYKSIFEKILQLGKCTCDNTRIDDNNESKMLANNSPESVYAIGMKEDSVNILKSMALLADKYTVENNDAQRDYILNRTYYSCKSVLQLASAFELYNITQYNLNGTTASEAIVRDELRTRSERCKAALLDYLEGVTAAFASLNDRQYDALAQELTGAIERLMSREIGADTPPVGALQ